MTGPPQQKIIVSTLNQGCRGAGVVFSGVVGTQHFCIGILKKCWYPSVCIGINGNIHMMYISYGMVLSMVISKAKKMVVPGPLVIERHRHMGIWA